MSKNASAVVVAVFVSVSAAAGQQNNPSPGAGGFGAAEVMSRIQSAYAALHSYADSGTVVDEATGFEDRSEFRTFFTREPSNLFIDFRGIASVYTSGFRVPLSNRIVFWMQRGDLQRWDHTGARHSYPASAGGQVAALESAAYGTATVSTLIPSLVYSKSKLATPLQALEEPVAAGYETLAGRRCFKVTGTERWRYPSGRVTGVRSITLWIDTETYLIRKTLQDTPLDYPAGSVGRRIITFDPKANPPLEPSVFQFAVPTK